MAVGEVANERGGNGLQETEEGAEGAAEEDDVVARVDGAGEGGLVAVEAGEDALEKGRGLGGVCGRGAGFAVTVELEELREEREDEGEGDLARGRGQFSATAKRAASFTYKVEEERDGNDSQNAFARLGLECPGGGSCCYCCCHCCGPALTVEFRVT